MTDSTLTHLYFLLDRSGSMQSIRTDTTGASTPSSRSSAASPAAAG